MRQPNWPPSSAVWPFELAIASCPKSSPLRARGQSGGLFRDFVDLLRRGRRRQRQQDVRNIELVVCGGVLLAGEILVELARRDVDVRDHVALTQHVQGHFLAHRFAVLLVVDALSFQGRGQLVERNLVVRGDLLQRAVQLLVRNRQSDLGRALRLDLRQHEPLQNLLFQNAGARQLDFLFFKALRHRFELRVQLALQHDAVVYDRGDAIQQRAMTADIAGLGDRVAGAQGKTHYKKARGPKI